MQRTNHAPKKRIVKLVQEKKAHVEAGDENK